jgi:hypothetical protein
MIKEIFGRIFDKYYYLKKCKTKEDVSSLFPHGDWWDKIECLESYLEGALKQELPSETRKAVCEYLVDHYLLYRRYEKLDKARRLFDCVGLESKEALLQAHLKANQLDHAEQLAKKMGQDAEKYLPGLLEKSVLSDRWDIVERTEKREKYLPDIFEKYLELDRWDVVNKMVEKDKSLEALLNEKRQGWIESVKKFSEKRTGVKRTKVEETAKEPTKIAYIPHLKANKVVQGKYKEEIEENMNTENFDFIFCHGDMQVWVFYKKKDELWAIFASLLGAYIIEGDYEHRYRYGKIFLCAKEKDDTDKSLSLIATTLKLDEKIKNYELGRKYKYLFESDDPLLKEDDVYEMELVDNPVKGKLSKKMFKFEKSEKFHGGGIEMFIINPQLPEHILKIYKEVKNDKIVLVMPKGVYWWWAEGYLLGYLRKEKKIKPFLISSEIGKEGSDDWEEEEWREYIDEFYKLSLDEYEKYSPIIKNKDIESLCRLDNQALKKLAAVAEAYEKEKK